MTARMIASLDERATVEHPPPFLWWASSRAPGQPRATVDRVNGRRGLAGNGSTRRIGKPLQHSDS